MSLPDSPCSRIPHTVTLVSIPASAEGNNGRRGRGFSVAIDQPLSPTNGYSPEHGPTVRVSQWVFCLRVCIVCTNTRRGQYGGGQRMKKGRWKMEDSVMDEANLKCIIEWEEKEIWVTVIQMSWDFIRSQVCVETKLFTVCRKVFKDLFIIFSAYCSISFRVDTDCISPDVKNSIHVGDRILEINGTPIHNVPLDEVFTTLHPTHCYWSIVLYCKYANRNLDVFKLSWREKRWHLF